MLPQAFTGIISFDRDLARSEFEVQLAASNLAPDLIPKRSTELMEEKLVQHMHQAIQTKSHFVLETPLSHGDYWKYLDLFESHHYQIQLNYLCLDKVSDCVARVGQRVLEGGHYVAPDTIKGVYQKNLQHIDQYSDTFKSIELYDGMKIPILLAKLEGTDVVFAHALALKKAWIKRGMPFISQKISAFITNQKK